MIMDKVDPLSTAEVMLTKIKDALPAVGAGLLVVLGFYLAALILRHLIPVLLPRLRDDQADLVDIVGTAAFWALIVLGLVSGLGTMGVNVGALIASLGLTGFALGFALRDALSNLLAGLLILLYRPFRRGDRITVGTSTGMVVGINLRYTALQDEGKRFLIPNQTLFTNPIEMAISSNSSQQQRPASQSEEPEDTTD